MNNKKEECEICGSGEDKHIKDKEKNELICKNCGNILKKDLMNTGEEYHPTGFEDHSPNLGSTQVKVIHSSTQSPKERQKGKRINQTQKYNISVEQKHKRKIKNIVSDIGVKLQLPQRIQDEVFELSNKTKKEGIVHGKSKKDVVISLIWVVSRKNNYPLLFSEMMYKAYDIPESSSKRTKKDREKIKNIKRLTNKLNQKLDIYSSYIHPNRYISRIRNNIDIPDEVAIQAKRFVNYYWKKGKFTGRDSNGVAGAVLSTLAKKNDIDIKSKDISDAAGVTSVTIRKISKMVEEILEEDDEEWKEEDIIA